MVPPGLCSGVDLEVDGNGVGQALREQVTHGQVFVVPFFDGFLLIVGHFGWILDSRAGHSPFEVWPMSGGLHCFLEVHDENCPVRTIRLKMRDVGR